MRSTLRGAGAQLFSNLPERPDRPTISAVRTDVILLIRRIVRLLRKFSGGHGQFPLSILARMIHERFCCKRGYAAATGSLAVQPFDILHEYASRLHVSECPSHFASARFRDEPS